MAGIYWLASYPKSGNTWMRILLTNFLRDGDQPADINHLDLKSIASARGVFDDWMCVDSTDMTPAEVDAHKPLLYEHLAKQAKEDVFLKVHDAYEYTIYDQPAFPPRATAGVLYLMRNPLDVAVSLAHHNGTTVAQSVAGMGSDQMALDFKYAGGREQFNQTLFAWGRHVLSWVDAPEMRVHVVRYEDMVMQPFDTFRQVVRFCGLPDDPTRVEKAIDFSRFDRLKRQETEKGFGEKLSHSENFFRKGKVGDWREHLNEKQIHRLLEDHGDVMRRFGYLTDRNEIVF